jgi:hypothetical protein
MAKFSTCSIAATVIGDFADVSRFPSSGRFTSYDGTAPIEVSSGVRKIYRLSMRAVPVWLCWPGGSCVGVTSPTVIPRGGRAREPRRGG